MKGAGEVFTILAINIVSMPVFERGMTHGHNREVHTVIL